MSGGSLPGTVSPAGKGTASITLTIPTSGSTSGTSITRRTPQTISASTESITVSVNGGSPQIFNAAAPTCTSSQSGLTCTLVVGAPFGDDGFLIITYSGQNGTGTALNVAAFTLNVAQGATNSATATAGNLITVNSSADGSGSGFNCTGGTCTLREAVAEASTTAGVYTAIMFQNVTGVTVSSPIEIGHNAAQNIIVLGPGATTPSLGTGAPSASSGLTISGGGSSGIFTVDSGSFLSVVGLTLANGNNTASENQNGGAIYNGGTLAIINSVLNANTGVDGGAIYDVGSGNSTVITSTFTGNNATGGTGGAIDEEFGFTVSHSLFDSNVAYDGSQYGDGGAIFGDGDLVVDSSTFTRNMSGNASAGGDAYGGAIEIDEGAPTITNSIFGTSTSDGNVAIEGSSGGSYGGAIVVYDASTTLTLAGNTFTGNRAIGGYEAYGGAVASFYSDPVVSTGDNFLNNTADGTSGAVNSSDTGGGAVYIQDVGDVSTFQGSAAANETFSGNLAKGGPGGVFAYGGAIYVEDYPFAGSNLTFSNNTATEAASAAGTGSETDGGALDVDSGATSLENAQFTGNAATAADSSFGGGAEVDSSTANFSSVSFTSNNVAGNQEAGGGGFGHYYGTVGACSDCAVARHVPATVLARQKARLARHTARATALASRHQRDKSIQLARKVAHAARVASHPHAQGQKHRIASSFVRPQAAHKLQLAACLESCWNNVTVGGTGSGNTSTAGSNASYGAHGGGADLSGDYTITATTVSNNGATGGVGGGGAWGGGISYGDYGSGTLTFTGGTISNNTTVNQGGGFLNYDIATITSSAITGNSVTAVFNDGDGGGGIWDNSLLTVTQSTISGNSVTGSLAGKGQSGGGGIFDYYGAITITNSTIASNSSGQDGGGIEMDFSVDAGLINNTLTANTATEYGGNYYDISAGVTVQGNIMSGGSATTGKDFGLDNSGLTSSGYNLIQTAVGMIGDSLFTPGTGDVIAGGAPSLSQTTFTANGVTMTIYAEQTGSNTVDKIPFAVCQTAGITVDQRGNARGGDGFCDIGAYEL